MKADMVPVNRIAEKRDATVLSSRILDSVAGFERRCEHGFTFVDDIAGRGGRRTENWRSASRYPCHGTDRQRPLRGPSASRQGAAWWRRLDAPASRRRPRTRPPHHTRDRRRGLDSHGVLRASSRAAGRARGARARRASRPLDLLFPDHAALRDRAPEVRVLESAPRRVERRSTRRRVPSTRSTRSYEVPWTLDEDVSDVHQPKVNENASTPASRNSISNCRSTIGVVCRTS